MSTTANTLKKTSKIKELKKELNTSTEPVVKPLYNGTAIKVMVVGFKKGMILREHKVHMPSKFTVLEGAVKYKAENRAVKLMQYDEVEIPIEIMHSVEAIEDSLCLLIKGE